jgi:hypothetical protein
MKPKQMDLMKMQKRGPIEEDKAEEEEDDN